MWKATKDGALAMRNIVNKKVQEKEKRKVKRRIQEVIMKAK